VQPAMLDWWHLKGKSEKGGVKKEGEIAAE
jgi:hypothetical protein